MVKKLTVLVMALGVMAVALPASASAEWLHHQTAISSDVQLGLTGQTRFQGALGGVECQITSRNTLLAGQTAGRIETYAIHPTSDTTNCKGLGGLAFCQIHDVTALGLPWTLHPIQEGGTDKTLGTHGSITAQLTGGFCPVKHSLITPGSVIGTPNQSQTVSSLQLSGNLQLDFQTTGGTVDKETMSISGTLSVESPNANTYSI